MTAGRSVLVAAELARIQSERARLRAVRDWRIATTPRPLRWVAWIVCHLAYQVSLGLEDLR